MLALNAPITTIVVCLSRLLECLRSLYGKQCGPRSDCSYRSSLLWVHAVCFYTQFVSNVRQLFPADNFSRRHFQMHFLLGPLGLNYGWRFYHFLTLSCFLSSADFFKTNFFKKILAGIQQSVKQLGSWSGRTLCQAWSGSKLFAKVISRRQTLGDEELRQWKVVWKYWILQTVIASLIYFQFI